MLLPKWERLLRCDFTIYKPYNFNSEPVSALNQVITFYKMLRVQNEKYSILPNHVSLSKKTFLNKPVHPNKLQTNNLYIYIYI